VKLVHPYHIHPPKKKRGGACLLTVWLLLYMHPCFSQVQNPAPPLGSWREHLNYQSALQVLQGDKIYCATSSALFSVDAGGDIQRYSKVTGLNDIGVSCIGWDSAGQQVVIAYANSNIDLLKGSSVVNIGDIKRSTVSGNKNIYRIFCQNGLAYLCSGLGVIVADLTKDEIRDTWYIGNAGGQVKVSGLTTDGNFFYAATDEGVKKADVHAASLANFANWQVISAGITANVIGTNGKVIMQRNDSLFVLTGNSFVYLYSDPNWPIVSITASGNKILVCERTAAGASQVLQLNTTGVIEKTVAQAGIISSPQSAILDNGSIWVADLFGGLSATGTTVQRYIPNGPLGTANGEMLFAGSTLLAAAGSVDDAWVYQYDRNGIYLFSNDTWSDEGFFTLPVLDSVLDFITLATDPADGTTWAGSYGGGLVHFGGAPVVYKKNNSSLQAAVGDPTSYRIGGLAFDHKGNLWIANYGAPQNLSVRKPDGSFKSFAIPFVLTENAVSQILVDDDDQVWIVSPKGNGVFVYHPGASIDATNDDLWASFTTGFQAGNLPSNNVFCIAKDRNDLIWIGTDHGIAVVQCAPTLFTGTRCTAVLPVVQQGQFAGYLFQDEEVHCIAVDGANRKWVGTRNGVWLISAAGDQIISRFTEDNSPLLNNDIKRIAIDPQSGEVFISTFAGICSFRGNATEPAPTDSQVLVFPNPVPPGYNGTIAIRGLADNSLVKIAELNGRLVYQVRALGGQATWNGLNYKGEKVASGVYLVLVRNDDGTEHTVTKIVLVSGR